MPNDSVPPSTPPIDEPSEGPDDLSAFDSEAPIADYVMGSDDDALRKIRRRTTPIGRAGALLFVGLFVVIAYLGITSQMEFGKRMEQLDALNSATDLSDDAINTQLMEILRETSHDSVRTRAIKNLGARRVGAASPLLIEQLAHAGGVRNDAAWALSQIGPELVDDPSSVQNALFTTLADTDEFDRNNVLWALAIFGEDRAAEDILEAFGSGQLQGQDGFNTETIAAVLGANRLSSESLTNHTDVAVRVLTAHALADTASPEVVGPLGRMLTSELEREEDKRSNEVIRATTAGLGRSGDPQAAAPLFRLIQELPAFRTDVLDALQRSTGAPGLVTLLNEAEDVTIRRDLTRLVAEARDSRVRDALAGLLTDSEAEIRSTAAFALADLGDRRATVVLLGLVRGEDEGEASLAVDALRNVATPELAAPVLELLGEEEMLYYRAQLLRVLGRTGEATMARHLLTYLDGDDVGSAAMALADLNDDGAFRRILEMAERPEDEDMTATAPVERLTSQEILRSNRLVAIRALARFGREDAVEALMTIVEDTHDDFELRANAAASIGLCGNDEHLTSVLAKIQDDSLDDHARRYYVQALWQKPRPGLNGQLLDLIASDANTAIRRAAALAVGYSGDESVSPRLMEMLESSQTRQEAAIAIILGGSTQAAQKLLEAVQHDPETRNVLASTINDNRSDRFHLITEGMFESGQIFRRLRAGEILSEGTGTFGFAEGWASAVSVLQSGWDGAGGASRRYIRERLWQALTGDNEEHRRLAAKAMVQIPERGLLLRARDESGPGQEVARDVLRPSSQ
jgi:HEAT repeat protein